MSFNEKIPFNKTKFYLATTVVKICYIMFCLKTNTVNPLIQYLINKETLSNWIKMLCFLFSY